MISGLVAKGALLFPAAPEISTLAAQATLAISPSEGRSETGDSAGDAQVGFSGGIVAEPQFGVTPGVAVAKESTLFTLPQFKPLSVETSPASMLDVRLKVRLARIQLEPQEKLRREEREFQLRRELEMKKLEADTAVRMRQLELQKGEAAEFSASSATSGSHTDVAVAFDVTIHISLVPVFREAEVLLRCV